MKWRVYLNGDWLASCATGLAAAVLAGTFGLGVTVKYGRTLVLSGNETDIANNSYDSAALLMEQRAGLSK